MWRDARLRSDLRDLYARLEARVGDLPVAKCAQPTEDPDDWFPAARETPELARELCGGCPVIAECLETALAEERYTMPWGIRGGRTSHERLRMRRRAEQAARRQEREVAA